MSSEVRMARDLDAPRVERDLGGSEPRVAPRWGGVQDLMDPLRLQVARAVRAPAGMVVTTGTYTGLEYARGDSAVRVGFEGFGAATLRFVTL
jgi:hypothetical protein